MINLDKKIVFGVLVLLCFVIPLDASSKKRGKTSGEIKISKDSLLFGLPSKAGSHVKKIKGLKSNSWLYLGKAKDDPKWGQARGRAYSPKMAYAPAIKGAFFTCEGVHGFYDKTTGIYQDGVWFYDSLAHAWRCAKPGTNGNTISLKLNKDGFEVDEKGNLVPVAFLGHGNDMTTYDTDLNRFVFVSDALNTYWKKCMGERRLKWLKKDLLPVTWSKSPWVYDVAEGKWIRKKITGFAPKFSAGRTTSLQYIPSKKKIFVNTSISGALYFDVKKYAWEKINTKGTKLNLKGTQVSMYDPDQERIYFWGMSTKPDLEIWYFDIKKSVWVNAQVKGTPMTGKHPYVTSYLAMNYDSKNKVGLLKNGDNFWIFDCKKNTFQEKPLTFPPKYKAKWMTYSGFYSSELNAHYIFLAGDSRDNGVFWVYRYK